MPAEIVLFDGVCGLCNALVRFVLDRDPTDRFRFSPLQGSFGAEVLERHGRDARDLDTLYVVFAAGTPEERILSKSRAALYVLSRLRGPARLLRWLGILPTAVLDVGYDLVARVRYRLFGRTKVCRVPSAAERAKLLES